MNALQLQNLATLAAAAAAAQSSASPSTASALTSSTGSLGALASPGNRRPPSLHRYRHHSHCCSISTTAVTLFSLPSIELPSSTSSYLVIASEKLRHGCVSVLPFCPCISPFRHSVRLHSYYCVFRCCRNSGKGRSILGNAS